MNKSYVMSIFLILLVTFVTFSSEKSNKLSSNTASNNFAFLNENSNEDNNNLYKEIKSDINFDKNEKQYIRKYLYPLDVNIFDIDEMENIYLKYKHRATGLLVSGLVSSVVGQLAFVGFMFTETYFPLFMVLMYLNPQAIISVFASPEMLVLVVSKVMLALTAFALLTIPFVLIPLAAIAYWHAGKVKNLAKKVNGEFGFSKLDKISLFMMDTDINNNNCKIDLDMKFRI